MEVELARKAGLGWRGKHTLLLNRESGSTFFLGEILVDVPLPIDEEVEERCGTCTSCIDVCPTQAITAPYQLDARRCISYLTIENPDAIPVEFRKAMGNRVYGCDDCQLICPWNKFAKRTELPDFARRHGLGQASLLQLWSWTEAEFEQRHEGSAIRRIGYSRWRRNLAVAMGNALGKLAVRENCAFPMFMPPSSNPNLSTLRPWVMAMFLMVTVPKVSHLPVLGKVMLLAMSCSSSHNDNLPLFPALPLA